MPESRERLTARKVRVKDLKEGQYYEQEGFDPNYLLTPHGLMVSRSRILGTVVDTFVNDDESYGAVTVDDGSGTIRGKFFQELEIMEGIEEGDIVEMIGKVKEYEGERYVNPELVVKRSPTFELVRAMELDEVRNEWADYVALAEELVEERDRESVLQELQGKGLSKRDAEGVLQFVEEDGQEGASTGGGEQEPSETEEGDEDGGSESQRQSVVSAIEKLDGGDGIEYGDIREETGIEEELLEDVINDLLSDGTCYEPRPGRIKKL